MLFGSPAVVLGPDTSPALRADVGLAVNEGRSDIALFHSRPSSSPACAYERLEIRAFEATVGEAEMPREGRNQVSAPAGRRERDPMRPLYAEAVMLAGYRSARRAAV